MDDTALTPHDGYLRSLVRAAARIARPLPSARSLRDRALLARSVDWLLVRVARGRGALDVAIGERLDALRVRGHALRLGFSTDGEYVRERLGDSPSTAQKLSRFSRALRERPLLRAAVRNGHVTRRQAEAVLPVARGDDEALWVDRARTSNVRALQRAVKGSPAEDEDDEPWRLFSAEIPEQYQAAVEEVMNRADQPFTAATIRADRVEAVAHETLGELAAYSDVPDDCEAGLPDARRMERWLEETAREWAFVDDPEKIAAPGPDVDFDSDARQLDSELRHYYAMRDRWDEQLGCLARIFRAVEGWRWLRFASFEHYCAERLGMHAKTVRQRAALDRQLSRLPSLKDAARRRLLSYEKVRLIARFAPDTADEWIERAQKISCIALRRELQRDEDRKMCARGSFRTFLPRRVHLILQEAIRAVRRACSDLLSRGECYGKMCARFQEVWPLPRRRNVAHHRIRERDEGLCQVPGCSRAAAQVHHVVFRSHGGGNRPENLVSLCGPHHHGVHMGWIRVSGKAPDRLQWQLGVRPGLPPILEFVSTPEGSAVLVSGSA